MEPEERAPRPVTSEGARPATAHSDDEGLLHRLGYAQELFRGMGGFRNFAISFTIISILAGCLTSYNIGFEHGGPMWVVYGWLLVGLMATIISLSMAEIASAYPTAGGLYYWASKLGSPGWGWATGWFNLIARSPSPPRSGTASRSSARPSSISGSRTPRAWTTGSARLSTPRPMSSTRSGCRPRLSSTC